MKPVEHLFRIADAEAFCQGGRKRVRVCHMRFVLPLALVMCLRAAPDPPVKADDWHALEYLLGDWTGEGSGDPGQGSGSFSFKPDLQGRVLVRKNRAEYPATKERAAFTHDDLMIVYREPPDTGLRAMYFDNEGHVIHYGVEASPDGARFVFLSAPEASEPRFRLTYKRVDRGKMKIQFEIAPPGHPDKFATYIEAAARRAE
jgi:hypothetical protein